MDIEKHIQTFFHQVENGYVDIYNEFSFQHELGVFLRNILPKPYKVEFERHIHFFDYHASCLKSEIDIVVYHPDYDDRYAIELKFPKNGQYPESMFHFAKDIKFMEQLKRLGFTNTYAVTYVEDRLFYRGLKVDGIYAYFRNQQPLHGEIRKPTGKKDELFYVEGHYSIDWTPLKNGAKTYIVTI